MSAITSDNNPICLYAAEVVSRQFWPHVSTEDMLQEAYLWMLTHPMTLQAASEEANGNRLVNRLLVNYLTGQARSEKAARLGYSPDDEAFYSTGVVESLLPMVWADEPSEHGSDVSPEVRRRSDPATRGNYIVMVADIRRAWRRTVFARSEGQLLYGKHRQGMTEPQLASVFGMDVDQVRRQIKSGLWRMVNELGGIRGGCPKNCECSRSGE